ncbi:MAG: L-serine ammonia-lyase, iron-sulfur-dependent, subunit alpha [Clostridiales bacterium]|nr:L-serine ammonia-lyase, iron-sulfur-dependent, subunit alpha [Clostridiales bacterium]
MKSLTELYRCGMGPSSSHTIAPENACRAFLSEHGGLDEYKVMLYGSLAKTGKGHMTDRVIERTFGRPVAVEFNTDKTDLPHPNTFDIIGYADGEEKAKWRVTSIGGGAYKVKGKKSATEDPYPCKSFRDIEVYCTQNGIRLYEYAERYDVKNIRDYIQEVWGVMQDAIVRGLSTDGVLDGGLNVKRKAKTLYESNDVFEDGMTRENRLVCAFAFAVGEENASCGKIVTAPTCGAAGVLPAVLYYYKHKYKLTDEKIVNALLTAGVVGNVVKTNASISGAECGCQAEIGTACSMAAAALGELFNMNINQIEYAAEVALEHHLGLTCDPIKGLVQIPCIERNAVAAMRAINAVNLANFLTDSRKISFDMVVATMYKTGKDMSRIYRETAEGGLAKAYNASEFIDDAFSARNSDIG